jgi:hypothetical protein
MSREKRNKDLHLFTSNVIFNRIARVDMDNQPPSTDLSKLNAESVMLRGNTLQKAKLEEAYAVLLGRTLCQLQKFQRFKKFFPPHIPHEYSKKMSKKSMVFPLPIQFKNESKHEDCMAIMDAYEKQLSELYNGAFGKKYFKCIL